MIFALTLTGSAVFAVNTGLLDLDQYNISLAPPVTMVQAQTTPVPTKQAAPTGSHFMRFPDDASFETGDTWVSKGKRYRLYGLQSCIRGTQVTISQGVKRDCGELNLIMAQALIRDTKPVCTSIRSLDERNDVVVCQTTTGNRGYDLATYMIAQGWGFAAVAGNGTFVVPAYRTAEETAGETRSGLWVYSDMPHPMSILYPQKSTAGHK
ncbi:thermonuclease family protein [Phyllobacterium sophorae]|nr:thermonuclease family protein [Phyllobacterium sophorae]